MSQKDNDRIHLATANIVLLIVAAVIMVIGYFIMSFNEITISPILLILAYVLIIPFALLWHPKKEK